MSKDKIAYPISYTKADHITTNEEFVEFIKKNATYKYIEDAKLLPDDGTDRTRYTKVLVVNRVEFDMSGVTLPLTLDIPDDLFPNTNPDGVNDTTSTTMVLFDHCCFLPSPISPTVKLRFKFNTAFKKCWFNKGAELSTAARISLIGCRANYCDYRVSVTGVNQYATAKISDISVVAMKLDVGFLFRVDIVNCKALPTTNIYHCRKVNMTNVSGIGFKCRNLHGVYDGLVSLDNCNIHCSLQFESSVFNLSIKNTKLDGIYADYCIVESLVVHNSKVGVFRPNNCILHCNPIYDLDSMAMFPMNCTGEGVEDLVGFTLYKQVCLWKGLAAISPKLSKMLYYDLPFDFVSRKFMPDRIIAKLRVRGDAKRYFSPHSHKIRVSEAKVIGFFAINKDPNAKERIVPIKIPKMATVRSIFNTSFKYKLDTVVKPKKKFSELHETCASGIHGFLDLEDAISY